MTAIVSSKKVKSTKSNASKSATAASTSPEVSASAPTLVTSAAALAPAVAAASPPMTPPGDLPPATGAPAPREGWVPAPKKKKGAKGLRPKAIQATNAAAVAKELTESATYASDFGSRAPAAGQVAFVVTNAAKWRDVWQGAKKFYEYASEQRATWENAALEQTTALKPAFEYAASRDTTVGEKYAATSKFLGATNAISSRAATSRKANAKAKAKKGEVATATAPATPAPEAAAPVAPVDMPAKS